MEDLSDLIVYYSARIDYYTQKGFPGYSARMLAFFDVGAPAPYRRLFDHALTNRA